MTRPEGKGRPAGERFTTRPELSGTFGMAASTHWLATAAAMAMLERGGNAFDAAAAGGFVLQVVEPHLNGPGGDMPVIVGRRGENCPLVLCGQGPAPRAATREHFAALGLDLIPGSGLLAAAVPGATDAWLVLLRDHGTLPLREILEPAIGYARSGHPILPAATEKIAGVADLFRDAWPTSAATFLPGGRPPVPGSLFRNERLADVYERLVREGEAGGRDRADQVEAARRAWSAGFVAEAVDRFARTAWLDSSGRAHAGVLTGDDMAAFESAWEPAVTYDYQGATICKTGAWGQGPVLLQQLALLDGLEDLPFGSAGMIHQVVECAKLAFADREAFYGDVPDVPLATLLGEGYNAQRRRLLTERASRDLRPGSPDGRVPVLPRLPSEDAGVALSSAIGEPTVEVVRGDTCHIDVVDRHGTFVSATPSGGWLHSSPVVPELGFPLGTRLQMFWLQPGLPNSLQPGKRPRTTLSPTLVMRDGGPVLALGTPGGDQQDQWQLVFLLAHLVAGMNLQEAIDAPTWHTTAFPGSFYPRGGTEAEVVIESRIGARTIAALRRRGHEVTVAGPWSLGRLSAVSWDRDRGTFHAAANARGMQGYAAGR